MKMPKKSVSVLLSLIMVLGVFFSVPFSFGAAEVATTWQQVVSAVKSGRSVMLGADIMSDSSDSVLTLTSGKDIEFDLNGYSLSRGEGRSSETGYIFKIESEALIVHDLARPEKAYRVDDVRVVAEPKDVVVGRSRLLFEGAIKALRNVI